MPSNAIDSLIFKDMYGTDELRAVFSDEQVVQCWLDYEAALARAEAAVGLVPLDAADEITRQARVDNIDFQALRQGIYETTHELVPLIWQLASLCEGTAGGYVHWGATTQDVTDTGLILQVKAAYTIILRDLRALAEALADLARRERDTIMPGRTHGQHALPITFGFKVAVWLAEVRRHIERLEQAAPRVLVGQFAGAAGTLASVGEQGLVIQRLMMADLGLGVPEICWHPARDGLAEYVSVLAMIAMTMSKIAHEVILLQKSEVAELEEPYVRGKVGSSTMPHKRNPMICEGIQAEARMVRGIQNTVLSAMESEHERDWAAVHVEWACVPEASILAGGAVAHTLRVITDLIVYPRTHAPECRRAARPDPVGSGHATARRTPGPANRPRGRPRGVDAGFRAGPPPQRAAGRRQPGHPPPDAGSDRGVDGPCGLHRAVWSVCRSGGRRIA